MRHNYIFTLLLTFFCVNTFSQVVTIGTGTEYDDNIPIAPYYAYSYAQNLYLASEINTSGNIYRIKYKGKEGLSLSNSNEWVIYMGHTSNTVLENNTWISTTELSMVFTGTISVENNDVLIELDTPFDYNGTDNLIIAVDENQELYDDISDDFLSTNVDGQRSLSYRNDNTNPDPENPPSNTIGQSAVANIDLDFNVTLCDSPLNLTASNVTATTADVSWTNGGTESSWSIQYGMLGFEIGTGTTITGVTTPSYNLTDLSVSSTYQFYVQANCDEGNASNWVGPYEFSTMCSAMTDFNQNFDDYPAYTLPNCWGEIKDNGASPAALIGTYTYASPYSLDNHIRLYNENSSEDANIILVSPEISNLSAGTHRLRFYSKNDNETQDLEIGTLSDPTDGTTFTPIESLDISTDYTEFALNFNNYTGTDRYIGLRRSSTVNYTNVYVDNMVWEEIPSCPSPSATSLSASIITSNAANLSWVLGLSETTWNIEYGETGFTQGNGTVINGVTENPYQLTGLTPVTSYDFYVQADCGGGDESEWVGPYTFTTSCLEISSYPYVEGFEGIESGQPLCWSIEGTTETDNYNWNSYEAGYQGRGMRFNSYYNLDGRTSELISPIFNLSDLTNITFSFYYKNPTGGEFKVLISNDGGTNYTVLEEGLVDQENWEQRSYDLNAYSGSGIIVKFIGISNYGNGDAYIYLDEIMINGSVVSNVCTPAEPGENAGDIGCVNLTYQGQTVGYTTVRAADGNIWLQQNLGSSQVASAKDDEMAYGDLFQWGRFDDGHQLRDSEQSTQYPTPNNPVGLGTEGMANFFIGDGWWSQWSTDDKWEAATFEAVTVTNAYDPCKAIGEEWSVPTESEWETVITAEQIGEDGNVANTDAAFGSNLKLTVGGRRSDDFFAVGQRAYYWSKTVSDSEDFMKFLYLSDFIVNPNAGAFREQGNAVRCVKPSTMGVNNVTSNIKVVKLYPNPVISGQDVVLTGDVDVVEVFTTTGQLVKTSTGSTFSTKGLTSGIYFVRITRTSGNIETQKLLVK